MTTVPFRIAAAQSAISTDVRRNGQEIRALMRQASEAGARLVQFPEGALSGYCKAEITDWADVDWAAIREELEKTAALAGELRIWTVLGCAHRLSRPHRPHNSLYVISDTGTLVDRYDKRFCSHAEISDWYSPGFRPVVFTVDGFRFGTALCIEVRFPEVFAEYERLNVDCVLLSSYSEDPVFGIHAQAHAATNCYWMSFSVPAQCDHAVPASLIAPNGSYLDQATPSGESGLAVGELNRNDADIEQVFARAWRTTARSGRIYASRRVADPRSVDTRRF